MRDRTSREDGSRRRPVALVVGPDERTRGQIVDWLIEDGCHAHGVGTFEAARQVLAAVEVDLLIAEVRLGAYHGLHLAIVERDRRPEMAAVLLSGAADEVLAADARQHGVALLVKPLTRAVVGFVIEGLQTRR